MTPANWASPLHFIWLFLPFPIWKPPCWPLHVFAVFPPNKVVFQIGERQHLDAPFAVPMALVGQ